MLLRNMPLEKNPLRRIPALRFLASGFSISLIRLCGRGAVFLATMLMARTLSSDDFGAYAFVLSYLMVVSLVGGLGLEQVALVTIARRRAAQSGGNFIAPLRNLAAGRLWTICLIPALAAFLSSRVVPSHSDILAIFLIALVLAALSVLSGALRGFERPLASTIAQDLPRGGALLSAAVLIQIGMPLGWFWWAALVALVFGYALSMIPFIRSVRLEERGAETHVFTEGTEQYENEVGTFEVPSQSPFMLVLFATNLYVWAVPLLLESLSDVSEVGSFNVAMQYPALVSFVSTSLSILYTSKIAFLHSSGRLRDMRGDLRAGSWLVLAIAMPMVLAIVFFGESLLALFGAGYRDAYTATLIVTMAQVVAIGSGPAGFVLLLSGREKLNLAVMASTNAAGIAVAALLAASFGHLAGAIGFFVATVSANLFMTFYCVIALRINTSVTCVAWWPKEADHG